MDVGPSASEQRYAKNERCRHTDKAERWDAEFEHEDVGEADIHFRYSSSPFDPSFKFHCTVSHRVAAALFIFGVRVFARQAAQAQKSAVLRFRTGPISLNPFLILPVLRFHPSLSLPYRLPLHVPWIPTGTQTD